MNVRLTRQADVDIVHILRRTRKMFGTQQILAYAEIIRKGIATIASEPPRPSSIERSQIRPGLRSFHLELVTGRRHSASHMLYYGLLSNVEGAPEVIVYRVLFEAMEPKRRLVRALRQTKRDAPDEYA